MYLNKADFKQKWWVKDWSEGEGRSLLRNKQQVGQAAWGGRGLWIDLIKDRCMQLSRDNMVYCVHYVIH